MEPSENNMSVQNENIVDNFFNEITNGISNSLGWIAHTVGKPFQEVSNKFLNGVVDLTEAILPKKAPKIL